MSGRFITVDSETARTAALRLDLDLTRALLKRDPDHLAALLLLGDTLTRIGEHEDALMVDRHLTELRPRDALVRYNLACSFSNMNRIDEALTELAMAIRLGYREFDHMLRDPDLSNVRRDPRFRGLIRRLRRIKA